MIFKLWESTDKKDNIHWAGYSSATRHHAPAVCRDDTTAAVPLKRDLTDTSLIERDFG